MHGTTYLQAQYVGNGDRRIRSTKSTLPTEGVLKSPENKIANPKHILRENKIVSGCEALTITFCPKGRHMVATVHRG